MNKAELKVVVADQRRTFLTRGEYVPRDIDFQKLISVKETVIISGVRRAGKSTLLRIIADSLFKTVSRENIFYLNFDDERLVSFSIDNFNHLLEIFLEKCGKGKHFFFLDEVQNVSHWEKWVNRLSEQEKIKVFVTGSNASLLSSEIATSLTGRNMTVELFPFSFREFLRLRKRQVGELDTRERVQPHRYFLEYIKLG